MSRSERRHPSPEVLPAWVAGRYRVVSELGRGGAGRVFAVVDGRTQRTLALKQLSQVASAKKAFLAELFRAEYQTLAQLSHPHVVEVYDYGIDAHGPYYTMELLEGGDLDALAPVDFRSACALVRDVAFCLVILHARGVVHRDVTPSNVRRTRDGRAKLIDFGAMTVMGRPHNVVGTPAFLAPEALRGQAVDGRTDLFALGALAYWLLTRRLPFPAGSFAELEQVWQRQPRGLRELSPDIPEELDALVLSLLRLDIGERPASAVEVIERLSAIAELSSEGQLLTQAHLATPLLVGRQPVLEAFAKYASRAQRARGTAWILEGAPGMGKSRMLDRCVLDARLMGATVLRASSEDARMDGTLLDTFRRQWAEAHGTPAQDQAGENGGAPVSLDEWVGSLRDSGETLVLAVDNAHASGEASLASLAALARMVASERVLLIATLDPTAASPPESPLHTLRERAKRTRLAALEPEQTRELLRSIFGSPSQLGTTARWIHEHSQGSPRVVLDLVRHLLDHKHARYEGGGFILPDTLEGLRLPTKLEDALDARVARLSPDALWLGGALALTCDHVAVRLDDFAVLLAGDGAQERAARALSELAATDIIRTGRTGPTFVQPGLISAFKRRTQDVARALHLALAKVLQDASYEAPLAAAHHLQHAGEASAALEILLACAAAPASRAERYQLSMAQRIACYVSAEEECRAQARPPAQLLALQIMLARLAAGYDVSLVTYAHRAIERLRLDSGLVYWEAITADDPVERIKRCVFKARLVHEATPEAQRGMAPADAIKNLAEVVLLAMAAESRLLTGQVGAGLPAVIEPFAPLSPAVGILWMVTRGIYCKDIGAETRGWYDQALAKIEQANMSVLSDLKGVVTFSLGCDAAAAAPVEALQRADALERDPWFVYLAEEVRMLVHLYAGDTKAAAHCRERRDACPPSLRAWLKRAQLLEVQALAASEDLIQLKSLVESIREQAETLPGFEAAWHWARAEYRRLRGQPSEALSALEACLARAQPGQHVVWAHAAPTFITTLVELGQAQRAHDYAQRALEEAIAFDLAPHPRMELEMAAARAEAEVGRGSEALARLEAQLALAAQWQASQVLRCRLSEVMARVALKVGDAERFDRYEREMERYSQATQRSRLITRHRLLRKHGRQHLHGEQWAGHSLRDELLPTGWLTRMREELQTTRAASQRAERALSIFLEIAECERGYFFAHECERVALMASRDAIPPTQSMLRAVQREVARALNEYGATEICTQETLSSMPDTTEEPILGPDGLPYQLVPLSMLTDDGPKVAGVIVLQTHKPLRRLIGPAGTLCEALLVTESE